MPALLNELLAVQALPAGEVGRLLDAYDNDVVLEAAAQRIRTGI